jgi:hypothetical protein
VTREQEEVAPEAPAPAEAEQVAPGQAEVGEAVSGVPGEEAEAGLGEEAEWVQEAAAEVAADSGSCRALRPHRGGT